MAWRRPGDKPLSEPMMVRLPTHICVTRPQWVNKYTQRLGIRRWLNLWTLTKTVLQNTFQYQMAKNCQTDRICTYIKQDRAWSFSPVNVLKRNGVMPLACAVVNGNWLYDFAKPLFAVDDFKNDFADQISFKMASNNSWNFAALRGSWGHQAFIYHRDIYPSVSHSTISLLTQTMIARPVSKIRQLIVTPWDRFKR